MTLGRIVLWPAVALMNRLRFTRKFLVIALLVLMPVAVVTWLVISGANRQASFNQKEADGVTYLRATLPMLEQVQRARIIAAAVRGGDVEYTTELALSARRIDALVPGIDAVDARFLETFRTIDGRYPVSESWHEIKAAWVNLQPRLLGAAEDTGGGLARLTARMMDWVLTDVANQSNLVLDPELDSYWLMEAFVERLPALMEDLAGIAALVAHDADTRAPEVSLRLDGSADRRFELATLHANAERLVNSLVAVNFRSAFSFNTSRGDRLKQRLGPGVTALVEHASNLLGSLQGVLLDAGATRLSGGAARPLAGAGLDAAAHLATTIGPELDALIRARVARYRYEQHLGTGAGALTVVLLCYVFVAFSSSVNASVNALGSFTRRMIAGTEQRFALETKDELGQVADLYNAINAALLEARTLKHVLEVRSAELSTVNENLRVEFERTEQTTQRLHQEQRQGQMLLTSLGAALIAVDEAGCITQWNREAERAFGLAADQVLGRPLAAAGISWAGDAIYAAMHSPQDAGKPVLVAGVRFLGPDEHEGFLDVTINAIAEETGEMTGWLLLAADVTDRTVLESQLLQAQKLESIGQLAAGIAHEINTPIQFIGDNNRFLEGAIESLAGVLGPYGRLTRAVEANAVTPALLDEVVAAERVADLDYLLAEMPVAVRDALEGIQRVAEIVRAMKEFSHPAQKETVLADLNQGLLTTITVARNEWKYVAEMSTDLSPTMPLVPCLPGELNQAVLNIIVNAAHAIAEHAERRGDPTQRGTITVRTTHDDDWAQIDITDTGGGIPEAVRSRIFDPFFTTKAVGKGTGQGLAIVHSVIVQKHGGTVAVDSEEGSGTTFTLRLPLRSERSGQPTGSSRQSAIAA